MRQGSSSNGTRTPSRQWDILVPDFHDKAVSCQLVDLLLYPCLVLVIKICIPLIQEEEPYLLLQPCLNKLIHISAAQKTSTAVIIFAVLTKLL